MATWTSDELNKIGKTEEIQLASMRNDGTLHKPVTIWVVRVGDDLYVRSVNGREGKWFRGTQTHHEGHIRAGGVSKDVSFVDADPGVYPQVDEAYRTKYEDKLDAPARELLERLAGCPAAADAFNGLDWLSQADHTMLLRQ
jgi:hypothetical protein